ncbi:MAG: DUF362 domain-containing protein [Ruminococcaceae bacterium]|nr:DUF362 domain-containing protein [Oscillospiraceae bacterium]
MFDVSVSACNSYQSAEVREALIKILEPIGGLDWVRDGMRIAIKANLVSMMKPDAAATTHPALLCELVRMLRERGAIPIIGDSPGGLYNAPVVNRIYAATGMKEAEGVGAMLNDDYSIADASFPKATVATSFTYTAYLDRADAIINFCKLKTHGMMGMSAAVKNMFGIVPGTFKPEYHFRFPNHEDFASMLIDLNSYFSEKTKLCIVDAVVGMEGNGPTQGKPRKIGALLASKDPHRLDLLCAALIGLTPQDVPTLKVALKQGRIPASAESLSISGEWKSLCVRDFDTVEVRRSLQFEGAGKFAAMFVKEALRSEPRPQRSLCIGCKKCAEVCPAHVITMKKGVPVIDRKHCITCFCCQEFCPVGAMKIHRPLIARILNRQKKE